MALNTAALFDQPEYADVTVSYSGRKTSCHKIILCTSSDYFKKLCGPGSHFAESSQNIIELKEDHPDAVYQLLRFIYTGNDNCGDRETDYALQLEISKVAQKYLYPDLYAKAAKKFCTLFTAINEPTKVFDAITHVRAVSEDDTILQIADEIQQRHILPLMKVPGFRSQIDQDKDLMWKHLDDFTDFKAGLRELKLSSCPTCGVSKLFALNQTIPSLHLGHNVTSPMSIWIPEANADHLLKLSKTLSGGWSGVALFSTASPNGASIGTGSSLAGFGASPRFGSGQASGSFFGAGL